MAGTRASSLAKESEEDLDRKASRSWSNKQEPQRRSGSWVIVTHPLSESPGTGSFQHENMGIREAQKAEVYPAEGFKGHCGHRRLLGGNDWWVGEHVVGAVVQLDDDEELGPLHGMYGSMEAEYEVQRNIKRAELTALLVLPQESMWDPSRSMWTTRNN